MDWINVPAAITLAILLHVASSAPWSALTGGR